MSELYCKFQIPASNTVGRVVETKTFYKVGWTDGRMEVCTTKVKLYAPPHFMLAAEKHIRMVVKGQLVAPALCFRRCEELIHSFIRQKPKTSCSDSKLFFNIYEPTISIYDIYASQ